MKIINILILNLLINSLWGQNLTVPETVNYINKKLKENPKVTNNGLVTNKTESQIEATPDGYLIIYRYMFEKQNNESTFSRCWLELEKFSMLYVTVTEQEMKNPLTNQEETVEFTGMKTVKQGNGDCNSTNLQLSDDIYKTAYVKFSNEKNIIESLSNAFTYLLDLVKSNPNFSPQTDPNDPFSPSNFKKLDQSTKSTIETKSTFTNPKTPCNIQTVNRLDGTTVRYLKPELVGVGSNCELGLGIQTNGSEYFLITYVRYFDQSKRIIGNLRIKLANEQTLELTLYSSELATMKNEMLGMSIFTLADSDIPKLTNSSIKLVVFRETGNIDQIIQLNQNFDAAKRQLKCFGK
jgi:hypothetical protein